MDSQIDDRIEFGLNIAKSAKQIDDLIAVLCSTFMEISFLQTGAMPQIKASHRKVTLHKTNWQMDEYRKVVYLQTPKQREELFLKNLNRKLGFDKTRRLLFEHKQSKSKLPFSVWVENQPTP